MSAFGRKNSHLIFHTAVILLYLTRSLKCGPNPTLKPGLAEQKQRIFNSINNVRRIHDVPKVLLNVLFSNSADKRAQTVLDEESVNLYIPGDFEVNPPKSYFPLVNRMTVPNINAYARERQHNPIFQWYATRKHYAGYYTENTFLKYAFYTQLIWRDSKEVVIGLAFRTLVNGSYEGALILEFSPHGNLPDRWKENVLPAKYPVPEEVDPQILPTLNPLLEVYKNRIITSINTCRDIHGVPKVIHNEAESNAADYIATIVLEKGDQAANIYIPGENEKSPPTSYFPLVSRMEVPNMNVYANELEYNPVYQWYSSRKLYDGQYEAESFTKYGYYTQLIWKNSRQAHIGIAYKQLTNGKYEVVTFLGFYPEGNTANSFEFSQNVLPPEYAVPPEIDPRSLERPTHDPLLQPYQDRIVSLINQVRELHDVPNVQVDIQQSSVADNDAQSILEGKSLDLPEFYIPGKTKEPKGYFKLISRMYIPNMSLYAEEIQYNPILQWYAHRKYYPGFYEKNLHHKYGFYTQLIWKNSKKVAIGRAFLQFQNGTYEVVLILAFSPHGNVPDEWDENVLPSRFYIPPEVDPHNVTTVNPLNAHYKGKIFNSINRVRDLHDAPYVDYNIRQSNYKDEKAQDILDGKDKENYIPGVQEDILPVAYFHLISKMVVPEMNLYATERKYNPVYLWYGERKYCLDNYNKQKHPKCGFYTQLIWEDTKEVSIGITYKFNDNGTYDVITYVSFSPRGNIPELWRTNVLERKHPIPPDVDPEVD